ncbi:MAG: SlyX family protein [Burkholderiales bacterium]|nr:SlyX family protein [Burkholderiales bacterium]
MSTEDRLIDMETKLAHQEHLVESLSQRIYEQQQQIDKLELMCTTLVQRVRDLRDNGNQAPINERPPHY